MASILAKEMLNGQKLEVVRCEKICMSGGLVSEKMKYMRFLRKRMNTKPSYDPIHFRAPAKISSVPFWVCFSFRGSFSAFFKFLEVLYLVL